MAVAAPWVLNTYLERLGGPAVAKAGAEEALIFKGPRLMWRETQRSRGVDGPLVDVLAQLMVRGYADEQRQRLRNEFIKRLRTLAEEARRGTTGEHKAHASPPPPAAAPGLNPYDVLGVPPGASKQEIRTAWKARAMEYHPDRVVGLGQKLKQVAEEETRRINAAYEMIKRRK